MMADIPNEVYNALDRNEAVRSRDFYANKTKVLRLSLRDLPVRIKVTQSQAVAIKDTNEAFVQALFPDFAHEWNAVYQRKDCDDVLSVVSFMRERMELRRDIMTMAFSSPVSTLKKLKQEHQNF